jgi:uncharacterized phosphatase
MTVYLIRHGETDWNRALKLQGREDVPLNADGLRQAEACAAALKTLPADCVLTSPLQRAKVTAQIIVDTLGAPFYTDGRLIERDFGALSGFSLKDRAAYIATVRDAGEPLDAVADRMLEAIGEYGKKFPRIVAVSHGASINAVLARCSGGEIGSGKTLLLNTGVSRLSHRNGRWQVDFYNVPAEEAMRLSHELDSENT